MATFVSGPIGFAGTQFSELSATIGAFSKQSGFTIDFIFGVGGVYVISNDSSSFGCYKHSGSPASADYSVFADIAKLSGATSPFFGVAGRMAGSGNFYALMQRTSTNELILYRFDAGAGAALGTAYSHTLTSTPKTLELRMAGNQISGYLDGVLRIGPVTDGTYSAAGSAGIIGRAMREAGVADSGSLDNFDAVDAGGGGGGSVIPIFTQHRHRR